jgi:ABC-2 type transport system permease protein
MRSSVFWALVRKDMYVLRAFSTAGLVTGLLALGAMLVGKVGFAIGGILYLTANVATGIMIAMYGFMNDRKEQTRLFSLSLPISGQHHELAKLLAAFLSYGIPWAILTLVGAVLMPLAGVFPRGFMVYALLVQGCCLALFGFLIGTMFIAKSERLAGLAVITTNLLFSMFMVTLSQPAISGSMHGPQIVWSDVALWLLTGEVGLLVAALVFAVSIIFRTRDHL